jgi:hypothetical protein
MIYWSLNLCFLYESYNAPGEYTNHLLGILFRSGILSRLREGGRVIRAPAISSHWDRAFLLHRPLGSVIAPAGGLRAFGRAYILHFHLT